MRHNIDHKKSGKHCHNCKQLQWDEDDMGSNGGWCCDDRNYDTVAQESRHLMLLDTEKYRFKGKSCCDPKT